MYRNDAISQPLMTLRASKKFNGEHRDHPTRELERTFDCPSPLPAMTRISSTASPRPPSSPSLPLVLRNCRIRVYVVIVLKTISRRERSRAAGEVGESQWDRDGHCVAR
jgi:hypothetical protein